MNEQFRSFTFYGKKFIRNFCVSDRLACLQLGEIYFSGATSWILNDGSTKAFPVCFRNGYKQVDSKFLVEFYPNCLFFCKRTFMQKLCWRPFFSYFFLPSCHSLLFLELQSQVCHISEKDQKYVKKRPRWWPSNRLVKALSVMAKKGPK